ncbi:ATP-binding cassette domain-containing protein [Cribrihabitans pelagius]|uniref:ATP-binding cassette domain-containing protein n=1 Tax=Cribrihabitans pelagius TaxID=1765746 RepID=UPI003B5A378F
MAASALNPTLTVSRRRTEGVMRSEALNRAEAEGRAITMLDRAGQSNPEARLGRYPYAFSGGQRQRTMIGIALILQPRVLIRNEPASALDVPVPAQIIQLLLELKRGRLLTIVFVSRNLPVVEHVVGRMAVMHLGAKSGGGRDRPGLHRAATRGSLRRSPIVSRSALPGALVPSRLERRRTCDRIPIPQYPAKTHPGAHCANPGMGQDGVNEFQALRG